MRSALTTVLGLALIPLSRATNVELPPCLEDFKPFVSSGCFQKGYDPALIFRSGLDQHNMTVEKCTAVCKGASSPTLTFTLGESHSWPRQRLPLRRS